MLSSTGPQKGSRDANPATCLRRPIGPEAPFAVRYRYLRGEPMAWTGGGEGWTNRTSSQHFNRGWQGARRPPSRHRHSARAEVRGDGSGIP